MLGSRQIIAAVSSLLFAGVAQAQNLSYCAGAGYLPSQYTCYDGFLCPVVNGVALDRCGSACYVPTQYSCGTNDVLVQMPAVFAPKVMIIDMFSPEGAVWYGLTQFNVLAHNLTIPGLSPLYPQVHCTATGDICQMTTGEGEINAAVSINSLIMSSRFNFTQSYFLIGGIAGGNPEHITIAGVAFNRYAVQVALQYEIDARELAPNNWTTGYFPQHDTAPGQYPGTIYGTEVFELNDNLRQMAIAYAKTGTLTDSATIQAYRKLYANTTAYAAGASTPSVVACDGATSDVYYSGNLLSQAFENYTTLVTNGTGVYCSTAQEDNATLEAMIRGAYYRLLDFSRVIVMRTISDFDRPYSGQTAYANLIQSTAHGSKPAEANIANAGIPIVQGIVANWASTFQGGVKASNYVGDILGSLGGTPDFGLPSAFIGSQVISARDLSSGGKQRRSKLPGMKLRRTPVVRR